MVEVNESWERVIKVISLFNTDEYITREYIISDYGEGVITDNHKEWTSRDGRVIVLGKKEDIQNIPPSGKCSISDVRKALHLLHNNNSPFIVGNNFYYSWGIELSFDNKFCIPTNLNNIIYYGSREEELGIICKEVYNYLLTDSLDDYKESKKYRSKVKKIC